MYLQFASNQLQNNKNIVIEAVKQNGLVLQLISNELKNDKDVVLQAVKQNGLSLKYASEELKNDIDFLSIIYPDLYKIDNYINLINEESK